MPQTRRPLNTCPPDAQRDVARQLRALADDLDADRAALTDIYASVNAADTTPEGATDATCEVDQNSYVMLLRFTRATEE